MHARGRKRVNDLSISSVCVNANWSFRRSTMFKLFDSPAAQAAARRAADRAERRLAEERATAMPDWKAQRAPERPQDQALAAHAIRWRDALDAGVRPVALEERFPRIVNRLALCWQEAALCDGVFESLLNDKRIGRRGFPAEITLELKALREYRRNMARKSSTAKAPAKRALELAPRFGFWDLDLQATSDR